MLTASQFMTTEPVSISATAPLDEVRAAFQGRSIRHLLLVDDEARMVGFVPRVSLDRAGDAKTAADLSERIHLYLRPNLTIITVLSELLQTAWDFGVVVDPEQRAQGIITEHDFVRMAMNTLPREAPALALASSPVEMMPPNAAASAVLYKMRERTLRHMVLGQAGRAEGILSWRDLVRGDVSLSSDAPAETLTSKGALITLSKDVSLREAARTMFDTKVGAVPLLDEDGLCAAIVSRTDLMRALLLHMVYEGRASS